MDISSLTESYKNRTSTPSGVVSAIYRQIEKTGKSPAWITLIPEADTLAGTAKLETTPGAETLPLYGIPFAVKDNFDVAGVDTTAACPEFTHTASESAEVIKRLLAAGAILIGKTNMDQFATGLVGTRTPYGICSSVFNSEYVSGGSSSGSAVSVAQGLVSFSLGSDTAGSGRVPAAFNNLVGIKPTRGLVSTTGLLPACRSLDCVSIFAETCSDAARVLNVIRGVDGRDPYSRAAVPGRGAAPWASLHSPESGFRFGVPSDESLEFFGDEAARAVYLKAVAALEALGGKVIRFDYERFRSAASLLYDGPWVAERLAAVRAFVAAHPDALEPTVKGIIEGAARFSAVNAFEAQYKLRAIEQETEAVWNLVDLLLLPTAPTIYKIVDVLQKPVELNSNLGYYTNFVNLLDLAAIAVPAGMRADRLPFGVTLVGRAFTDDGLIQVADRVHRKLGVTLGGSQRLLADSPAVAATNAPSGCILMAVVGAHLSGQPLNWQMTQRKARLLRTVRTHSDYRLYVLPNSTPAKPGLVYDPSSHNQGIELEVWAMPEDTVGTFLNGIPAPLSLGTVRLEDGSTVKGFLCEPVGIIGAEEITHLGGWRAYLATLK